MTSLPSTAQIDKARNMSEQIDYYLPVHRFGRKIGEVLVRIYPKWDEALGGLTVDIDAEDASQDMFRLSDAEASHDQQAILDINNDSYGHKPAVSMSVAFDGRAIVKEAA